MKIKINKYFAGAAVILLLILFVFLDWKCNLTGRESRLVREYEDSAYYKPVKERELKKKLSRAKDFYVTKTNLEKGVQSQMQWDYRIKEAVKDQGIIDRMKDNRSFNGGMKSSDKFQARIDRIDARIDEYRRRLDSQPNDQELIEGLNNLLQLRAMVNNLEGAVIEKR